MPEKDPTYERIDVARVTPRTSKPYALISFVQRNSLHVLRAENGKMLIGPLGVNYFQDGPADQEGVYLHRWDVPPRRAALARSRFSLDRQISEGSGFHPDL